MKTQHATPTVVDNLEIPKRIERLQRIRRSFNVPDAPRFLENLLQKLIHADPAILPVEEFEPAFVSPHPICTELQLGRDGTQKFADNVLINANGRICLVECKLWRNPEAVREVVAQILDYAGELSQMSYVELSQAVRKALGHQHGDPVIESVLGPGSLEDDQIHLIDSISRSLRRGDFLLLVVGDGIRSGLQQIAGLLQNRATLGFSFGLVEMAIYGPANGQGPYYVQPRLLLQTEIVTRTVFLVGSETLEAKIRDVSPAGKPQTISEQEFYACLAAVDPKYPDQVRAFVGECEALGCDLELKKALAVYVDDPTGSRLNVAGIRKDGRVEIWGAARRDRVLGEPVGRQYLDRVAAFLGNARVKDDSPEPADWHIRFNEKSLIPLDKMLGHSKEWLAAIQELAERLRAIEHNQDQMPSADDRFV